jgi:hypothetical protein
MGNYLPMATQHQISALLQLGWSHRRIARELGIHRETVARHAHQPGGPSASSGRDGVTVPGPTAGQNRPNPITGPESLAAPYHDQIVAGLERGLTAQRIWQDLRDEHGYGAGYLTVQRYARRIRRVRPEVADRLEHPPGDEALFCPSSGHCGGTLPFLTGFARSRSARSSRGSMSTDQRLSPSTRNRTRTRGCSGSWPHENSGCQRNE